jgi:hypothetical protein
LATVPFADADMFRTLREMACAHVSRGRRVRCIGVPAVTENW